MTDSNADAPAAVQGSYMRMRTMAEGAIRVEIDLRCGLAEAAAIFPEVGTAVAIARLAPDAAQMAVTPMSDRPYGKAAQALIQSGFFYAPLVWRGVGSDEDFLAWVPTQRCAFSKTTSPPCHGDVVAAHVRRIANGAGTAVKPEYSAIPMCDGHHRFQHQHGETALAPKEHFDRLRVFYVSEWARLTLRAQLGYDSWASVPPDALLKWAIEHHADHLIPGRYLEVLNGD